jgi:hypothetical protein
MAVRVDRTVILSCERRVTGTTVWCVDVVLGDGIFESPFGYDSCAYVWRLQCRRYESVGTNLIY